MVIWYSMILPAAILKGLTPRAISSPRATIATANGDTNKWSSLCSAAPKVVRWASKFLPVTLKMLPPYRTRLRNCMQQLAEFATTVNNKLDQIESGRFLGVKPLSWLALEGGNPDTSTGRCSPTLRRARGFLSAGGDVLHAGSTPSVVSSPSACSRLD